MQTVISSGQQLQQVFETIWQQRMQDMPMVNPVLSVAVIGFDKKKPGQPGIVLTPWCMNLVLLPEADEWDSLKPGSKQIHTLPSGSYEFVVADEPGIGRYQSCSLFSPMFEFKDQQAALATAEAALSAVMTVEQNAEQELTEQSQLEAPQDIQPSKDQRQEQKPLSRRAFLRGMGLR